VLKNVGKFYSLNMIIMKRNSIKNATKRRMEAEYSINATVHFTICYLLVSFPKLKSKNHVEIKK